MNKLLKQLLTLALIANVMSIYSSPFNKRDTYGKPFFAARSQGDNLARRLVGEVNELVPCFCGMNGVLSITAEYTETFHDNAIGRYFSFRPPIPELCPCDDLCAPDSTSRNSTSIEQPDTNRMFFRGLFTDPEPSPENTDVIAENFLLASTFNGEVILKPKVTNVILDFNWRMNLEGLREGLYIDVGVPVVWTRWNMHLEEITGPQPGNIIIPASAVLVEPFEAPAPVTTIIDAWRGQTDTTLTFESTTAGQAPIDITIEPMLFARINGRQKKRGIADVHFALGRNFVCTEYSHMAVDLRVIAPTGTRPEGRFVFEPIVGNGHHVGVGGGMSAHTTLWQRDCPDRAMNIWLEGVIYHLFKTKQRRTFDLRPREGMCDPLNEQTRNIGSRYLLLKRFNPDGTFANAFVPGPNATTLNADVAINVMGEFVVLFDYQWSNVSFDIGYNLWGRSQESITITDEIPENTFGILGGTPIDNNVPGAANRTNSEARINGIGYSTSGDVPDPVFLRTCDLDSRAAQAPAALTNKIFAHLGYTFEGCYYAVFMGIGGEVEFSGIRNNAFNQWGVWGKLGFAFM
ncbi:MAG: hypothetical protein AB7F19_00455 [Candidatus Babeliales bacterium]